MTVADSSLHASANNNESKLAPILEREQALNRKNSSKELEIQGQHGQISDDNGGAEYKVEIVWINVIRMFLLHVAFVVGLYYILSGRVMIPTLLFGKKCIFLNSQNELEMSGILLCRRAYVVRNRSRCYGWSSSPLFTPKLQSQKTSAAGPSLCFPNGVSSEFLRIICNALNVFCIKCGQ